ncbi:MAG TPA: alpha/beta hydrolase [Steroidobacteraceae bacterium]|nr:alpha/beta hydrolase [Steroidobacteraceae bacterium]
MSFDVLTMSRQIRALGTEISPQSIQGTAALYAPFQEREPYRAVNVARDLTYGSNERQRLDVFRPAADGPGAPHSTAVLLFVHGGGFVGGDKHMPGSPYNDNIALWAVRHGLVGVNMTYRLAPQFPWPAGGEDVAAAVAWTRANIARHGGDAARIVLMGTSAGAVHVASYLAHRELQPSEGPGVAAAVLLSGIYDLANASRSPMHSAYFGSDDATYERASTLEGLLTTRVPLLFVLTEMDPEEFQRQGLTLLSSWCARHGRWPQFVHLSGHNHLSSTMHLNSPDAYLGERILDFIGPLAR